MTFTAEPGSISGTQASFNAAGYSGPLSLLLDLIEQRKVDICEVSLAEITEEYLKRISAIEWPDLEESSRFLVIAATLLFIKARVLMPRKKDIDAVAEEEEGPDPAELLVDRLKAYKVFRDASRKLRLLEAEAALWFRRGRFEHLATRWHGNPLEGRQPQDLFEMVSRLLEKAQPAEVEGPRDEVPLAHFMNELLGALKRRRSADFLGALGIIKDRRALIGSFLALLELAKLGIISLSQMAPGEPIWMSLREEAGSDGPVADESVD